MKQRDLSVWRRGLEFHCSGSAAETIEGGFAVFEIENFGIFVVRGVHGLEAGVVFKHVDLGFTAIIADQLAGETDPACAGLVHGADFHLAVGLDLLGHILGLASLNVKLAFEDFDGTEGTDLGLVTIYSCQKIGATVLDEFLDFFHIRLQIRANEARGYNEF